ncbi:MAG: M4 family metallopeptidase [Nocardia sp.]|nr:M4 family metallopeptidase [Nocardia sp.]
MLVGIGVVVPSLPAGAQPQQSGIPATVEKDGRGAVRQVVPRQPVPVRRKGSGPGDAALEHAAALQPVFGRPGSPAMKSGGDSRLVVRSVARRGNGSTVRLAQMIQSIPVYGADLAVAMTSDGAMLSATGALAEAGAGRFPDRNPVPSDPARTAALNRVRSAVRSDPAAAQRIRIRTQAPVWYGPSLSGTGGPAQPVVPAYIFEIDAGPGVWRVFIAADKSAKVLDAWPIDKHLSRVVCDAASSADPARIAVPCGGAGGYPVVRTEGAAATGIADADRVYDWIGATEKFYATHTGLGSLTDLIGIDARDGRGKAMRATVRVCLDSCPYANAFWADGQGFVMGSQVMALDVVAHELTHGVTEKTSGLDYINESGAINESMSDVFAELAELSTKKAGGKNPDRWQIGNGSRVGVVRNMKSPGTSPDKQPETYRGPGWVPATYSPNNPTARDRGGVHINSGVGNRLAYLITDGGTVDGHRIAGLGVDKAAALYWATETMLNPSADYSVLGSTLLTACRAQVQEKAAGFTDADCTAVQKAIAAVRIPLLSDKA